MGDLQELSAAADLVSLHADLQAIRSIFRAEAALLPRKFPIETVGFFLGVRFLGQVIPAAEIHPQLRAQKALRHRLRSALAERRARARLGNFVLVANDVARRADAHAEFLFLLRAEKPHVPIPDVQIRGHQLVRLLQTELALEINLGVVIHVENDGGSVAADVLTQTGDELLRARQCFFAGDLKIYGRFRESQEKVRAGKCGTKDSENDPEQQCALVGTRQMFTGRKFRSPAGRPPLRPNRVAAWLLHPRSGHL